MPEVTLNQHNKFSRPLGISLGVTEITFLLGLLSLAAGVSLVFGASYALIVVGVILVLTAFYNDWMLEQGKR